MGTSAARQDHHRLPSTDQQHQQKRWIKAYLVLYDSGGQSGLLFGRKSSFVDSAWNSARFNIICADYCLLVQTWKVK